MTFTTPPGRFSSFHPRSDASRRPTSTAGASLSSSGNAASYTAAAGAGSAPWLG